MSEREIEAGSIADREAFLIGYDGADRVVSSREFWKIEDAKPRQEIRFRTGLTRLDGLVDGTEAGELWVVSGPTGHGKTTFCDTVGRNMARAGAKCLWFSFEVSPGKFLEKYKPDGAPVVYVPLERKPGSLVWLEKKVHEAKLKFGCRVVFIDHLHFIVDMAKMRNPSLEIGVVMRFLKTDIALKHNVLVFLISHVTKLKFEEEPSENDIRDSSFIAQEADGILMVYRCLEPGKSEKDSDGYGNAARVVVCKARRTGVLRARVELMKKGDDMMEVDPNCTRIFQ